LNLSIAAPGDWADHGDMRIATFNVQNLRLRGKRLDGARDGDDPRDAGTVAETLDPLDRRLTAEVIALIDADVLALQEVFDAATLEHFHDTCLLPLGVVPYPERICLPGNDGRGLDIALLSRRAIGQTTSHADITPRALGLDADKPDDPLFRRDALRVDLENLSLWVVHLKAPWPDPVTGAAVRRLESDALRRLIAAAHGPGALWVIAGDFNEPQGGDSLTLLDDGFAVDLSARVPEAERWTYRDPDSGRLSAPDRFLASPALAARWPAARPVPVRFGLDRVANPAGEARLPLVGAHRPHASDHAALILDLPGL
jgi:endonuclease/exonuclease/phosphatase family metal-dependent hydrolase